MASLSHLVEVSMFCDSVLKLRNHCLSKFSEISKSREPEIRRSNPVFFLSQIVSTGSAWF